MRFYRILNFPWRERVKNRKNLYTRKRQLILLGHLEVEEFLLIAITKKLFAGDSVSESIISQKAR